VEAHWVAVAPEIHEHERIVDGKPDQEEETEQRYAELNIGDEEFVIYDRQNRQAWIQSSVAVTVCDYQ
jgi:hypothetical protein